MDKVDSIELELVLAGYELKLTGATRIAAIREMYERGYRTLTIAERLKITDRTVLRLANENNIPVPRPLRGHWTEYYFKRSTRQDLKDRYMKE